MFASKRVSHRWFPARRADRRPRHLRPRFERLEQRWLCSASPLPHYAIGTPTLTDIWVDPRSGNDANSGASRAQAVRTLSEAWNRIPAGTTLSATGYRVDLVAGTYTENAMPGWWDDRHGSFSCPIILQAADGAGTAILAGMDVHDVHYLYLVGLRLEAGGGDVLHVASSDHVLLRDSQLVGQGDITAYNCPQESLKVNQSQYVYVEDCDISGAWGNAVDFVATQYAQVIGNRIHHALDWAMYVKGGSAYVRVEGNEIYDAGTGGFSAGQGTGFEFMVSPWLHYEAYDVKFVNNVIHDTDGAGIGVNGGYNILLAYNTMYRVGRRDHVIEVVHGLRGCDGDTAQARAYLAAGGWGTTSGDQQPIPDRHVYIYDNLVYNPDGYQSAWQQFAIAGPETPATGTNLPSPSRCDDDLQIRGNIIWNGPAGMPLGIEDTGVNVSAAQLRSENAINTLRPQLVDPEHGDFRPTAGGNVFSATTYTPPDFSWSDAPSRPALPVGNLSNSVPVDRSGNARSGTPVAGAYAGSSTPPAPTPTPTPASANLAVVIAGPAAAVLVGNTAAYTLTVTNRGPDAAGNVVLTDLLPSSFAVVSATASQGSAAASGGRLTASLGSLASGGSATVQLVLRLTAVGTFAQNVSVTSATGDPDASNNAASLGTRVDPLPTQTFACNTAQAISDRFASTVTSRLTVSGMSGTITHVSVRLNLQHARDADLVVTLIAPNGRRVTLVNRRGGSGQNFSGTVFDDAAGTAITAGRAPYSGAFRPESRLSALSGAAPNGVWRLEIADRAYRNGGQLTGWSLTLTTATAAPRTAATSTRALPSLSPGLLDALFADDLLTRRRHATG